MGNDEDNLSDGATWTGCHRVRFALWRNDQAWDWAEAEVAEGSFIKLTGHLPEMSLSCRVFELKVAEERVWRLTSTASIHGLRIWPVGFVQCSSNQAWLG